MEQKIKKIVVMLLVVVLVVNNVTYRNMVEVKAALPVVMSVEEIMSLIIGGGASASCLANGKSGEAEFKRAYQNYLNSVQAQNDAVASAFGITDAGLAVAAVAAMPQYYMDYAWQQYQTEDGREWGNVGDSGMSWPEIWAEINDQDASNYDLYARMMKNQNNPEDPNQGNWDDIKGIVGKCALGLTICGLLGIGKYGYDVWQTNEAIDPDTVDPETLTINPATGEVIKISCSEWTSGLSDKTLNSSQVIYSSYELSEKRYSEIECNDGNEKDKFYFILYKDSIYTLFYYDSSSSNMMCNKAPLGVSLFCEVMNNPSINKRINIGTSLFNDTLINLNDIKTLYKVNVQTNIPIFVNREDAYDVFKQNEKLEDKAINYQESTEETKQLQKIIDMFNQLLDDMENDGLEKPYKNILEAMQDQMKDMFDDLKDEVTPETTPEEVKDKVKDRIKKDVEDVEPIFNPIENPVPVPTGTPLPTETPKPPITDSTKEEQQMQLGGIITDVFPFCIPFDLIYVVRTFKAEPKIPHFEIPIVFEPLGLNYIWVIDFARFEPFAKVFRWFALLSYITSLILVTRKLIKG